MRMICHATEVSRFFPKQFSALGDIGWKNPKPVTYIHVKGSKPIVTFVGWDPQVNANVFKQTPETHQVA